MTTGRINQVSEPKLWRLERASELATLHLRLSSRTKQQPRKDAAQLGRSVSQLTLHTSARPAWLPRSFSAGRNSNPEEPLYSWGVPRRSDSPKASQWFILIISTHSRRSELLACISS
jgi:hypothetical protein